MPAHAELVYAKTSTPIGELLVVQSGPVLVRIAFSLEGFDAVLRAVERQAGARVRESTAETRESLLQLDQYFAGERREFSLDVDVAGLGDVSGTAGTKSAAGATGSVGVAGAAGAVGAVGASFRQRAQRALAEIPFGQVRTYGEVAGLLGSPKAARAVGSACATNPVPIVLPCHRVLPSAGNSGTGSLQDSGVGMFSDSGMGPRMGSGVAERGGIGAGERQASGAGARQLRDASALAVAHVRNVGNYAGGAEVKRALLRLEGLIVD